MQAGLDTRELAQLARDLETIARDYPDRAKKHLQTEGNKVKKRLYAETKAATTKRTGALLKGVRRLGVKKRDGDLSVTVTSKAPHAHLIEEGHEQYAPVPGKGRRYQRKTGKRVAGRYPAEHTVAAMGPEIERDAAKLADEVLRRGGIT